MKNTMTIVVIAAIVATGAGFLGYGVASNQSIPSQALVTSAVLNGHMKLIVTDSDGNVKAYRQTDNAITVKAENCVAKLLFKGPSSGTGNGCTGAITNPFSYVGVGTGTGSETNTNTDLGTELATGNLNRAIGTVTITNSTTGGTGSTAASVAISKSFSSITGGPYSITEAGLFNDTLANASTDAMFARKVFTAVSVTAGDTLTVNWTINIGNTTSIN